MASDNQFIRGGADRSSRTRIVPPSQHQATQPGTALASNATETVRQRAAQAAEYYHTQVRGRLYSRDSDDENKNDSEDKAQTNGNQNNEDNMDSTNGQAADAYYKAKLRAGFIDLRNSYNEKIRGRVNPYQRSLTNPNPGGLDARPSPLSRVSESIQSNKHTGRQYKGDSQKRDDDSNESGVAGPKTLAERRGLYRSNSSLELEHQDYSESEQLFAPRNVHREYGSASSLDVISNSGESFFQMLQGYKSENVDQRAPAPPKMQEALRGKVSFVESLPTYTPNNPPPKPPHQEYFANGLVPSDKEDSADIPGSHSPKLKSKSIKHKDKKLRNKSGVSEASRGILHKLRGSKSENSSQEMQSKSMNSSTEEESSTGKGEERSRRKAFIHFDCQSIGLTLTDSNMRRSNSLQKRRNTTTGASAASALRQSSDYEDTSSEDNDSGDGKSNDLLLSCPFFRNEIGGEEERTIGLSKNNAQRRVQQLLGNQSIDLQSLRRRPECNGVSILDCSPSSAGIVTPSIVSYNGLVIEHLDHGAFYYRNYFLNTEHQNFFGKDEHFGPVAISLKREKVGEIKDVNKSELSAASSGGIFQYRIIVRHGELRTLRGTVLEDTVPSSSRLSSSRGLPAKDILEYLTPELQLSALKIAMVGPKTEEQLLKLDEQGQGSTLTYKVGIMYCKAGQASEEEMYNNEHAGPAFEEFLDCIGKRIALKGFDKYRGGLDCKTDSTGTHSVYSKVDKYEIMFHVSTMLPFTANNRQQLLRKRHIGNDIVTIVFQEPGAHPFTPKAVRSHFQHVFIIVRVHNPNTDNVCYSLSVTRSKDVPPFGPPIPDGAMFNKSPQFAEFLLIKAINAENAAHKSDKFTAMATRTRQEYLKDLATNFVTSASLESGSKLSKFSLGSGRKKEKSRTRVNQDLYAKGAVVWNVQVEDFGQSCQVDAFLGIAEKSLVLIEEVTRDVMFTIACKTVIGWTSSSNSLRLYYCHGECVSFRTISADPEEIQEIVSRLQAVSSGCETTEMTLRRNSMGQLGFHVHHEGIVSDVEPYGHAWQSGIRAGSRLVEICKVATATLTHDQMIDLLRTSVTVKVVVIPPVVEGTPRRGIEDVQPTHSAYHFTNMEHVNHDDMHVVTASPRPAMIKSHSVHARLIGRTTEKVSPGNNSNNYADLRTVSLAFDNRGFNHSPGSHGKQPSNDSGASRSSGHGSLEGLSDNIGEEKHRYNQQDHPDGAANYKQQITIYPAYNQETSLQPSSQHSPNWYPPTASHQSPNYSSGEPTGQGATGANYYGPKQSRGTQAYTYQDSEHDGHLDNSYQYYDNDPTVDSRHPNQARYGSRDGAIDTASSHSSGSNRQHVQHYGSLELDRNKDNRTRLKTDLSPMGQRRQQAFQTQQANRRSYIDTSPNSSNRSSPQPTRKDGEAFMIIRETSV